MNDSCKININIAQRLIYEQFPEYKNLIIKEVEEQGHDNRTYRLGNDLLIRLPTDSHYALKVPKEQELLPQLGKYLSINIPTPVKMGKPSKSFPYPFSIYKWLDGKSINLLNLNTQELCVLAYDLAQFLKELQKINLVSGPKPGQHNWWRGDHISIYSKNAESQIKMLSDFIDTSKALNLLKEACATKWEKDPVWIHGDFAIGNMLAQNNKLAGIIDFGGMAIGDPACDLVIAWTYLSDDARILFINEMDMDDQTWLRSKAWALWKATFELCQITSKTDVKALKQVNIINTILS